VLYLHQRLLSPLKAIYLEEQDVAYRTKCTSIGHRILKEDQRAESVPNSIFKRLDTIILRVQNEITVDNITTINEAKSILERIEQVVTTSNFVCSIPYYLVQSFGDGLLPRKLDERLIYAAENELRRPYITAHANEMFSHVDCDLSSLLYLCIAEALHIPLRMVELPGHNFIRWRLNNYTHLNWDTNYGFNRFTDNEYAAHYGVKADQIVNGTYLLDLSTDNVEGYFSFVRGITFQSAKKFHESINEYRVAITKYPQSPAARNNIAWLFVSDKSVQQIVTKEEALELMLKACDIYRTDNSLDTLACVYAENGDFKSAITIETEAYSMKALPKYKQMIDAFYKGKTWLDLFGTTS